jgi:hypothetical protein
MGSENRDENSYDLIITIRFDELDGTPRVNIGDHDPCTAAAILKYVASYLEELYPIPVIEGTNGLLLGPADDEER